jgi:cardiolipin synthase
MLKAMESARDSIYIEMYIFLADTESTHDFLGTIIRKAKSGVKVVIVADMFGSFALPRKTVDLIRDSGAEFLYFYGVFKHTHRKMVIIDRYIAFLGGVNIEEKIRHWRDLQIRVQGKIILPIVLSFAKMYRDCGGRDEKILSLSSLKPVQKIKSWIVENIPGTNRLYYLNYYYRSKLAAARESIKIVTPYLSPPRWLLSLLSNAVARGVLVEIIIPEDTDIKVLNRVNRVNAARLSDFGVSIYLSRQMNHAKAMVIDGREGIIGSQNLDVLSFGLNMEVGLFFSQKDIVSGLLVLFEKWKAQASLFSRQSASISWGDWALLIFTKIIYPIF